MTPGLQASAPSVPHHGSLKSAKRNAGSFLSSHDVAAQHRFCNSQLYLNAAFSLLMLKLGVLLFTEVGVDAEVLNLRRLVCSC